MPLKYCPQCGAAVHGSRKTCFKCGADCPSKMSLKQLKMTLKQWTVLILAIIILFTFFHIAFKYDLSSLKKVDYSQSSHPNSMAYVFCKDFVKLRLKSPSTAEFSPVTSTLISDLGGGTYLVVGSVSAQNSFGGFGLENYSCTVTASSDGGYTLNSLNMN